MYTTLSLSRRVTILLAALFVSVCAFGLAFSVSAHSMHQSTAANAPTKVKKLQVTNRTESSVSVQWKTLDNVDGYRVKLMDAGGAKINVFSTTKRKKKITDLDADTTYLIKVRAVHDDVLGKWSKTIMVETEAAPEDISVPEEDDEENTEPEVTPQTVDVSIEDFAFSEDTTTILAGDTVRWTNNDGFSHTVTAVDGTWNSGTMSAGEVYEQTFDTAGTYNYYCAFHPSMTATVVVQ